MESCGNAGFAITRVATQDVFEPHLIAFRMLVLDRVTY